MYNVAMDKALSRTNALDPWELGKPMVRFRGWQILPLILMQMLARPVKTSNCSFLLLNVYKTSTAAYRELLLSETSWPPPCVLYTINSLRFQVVEIVGTVPSECGHPNWRLLLHTCFCPYSILSHPSQVPRTYPTLALDSITWLAGDQTWVLWKSSEGSSPLTHL